MANHLFLIGINNYFKQDNLFSCVKDVVDIKNLLLEKYDFLEENTYEIFNESASNKNIQDAFRNYIKNLSEKDNLIIIYSGHGDYDQETDTGYWIPHEAVHYTNYVTNDSIIKYVSKIKAKHIFLISDSCFSNHILVSGITKGTKDYFDKKSRWALASAYSESYDSDGETNTLFAETIVEFLENAETDFRITELIEHVKSGFAINQLQKPQGAPLQVLGHEGGEFIFKIRQQLDKRKFRGYVGFEKILKYYKRNSDFSEVESFEDRTNKIGYLLYQELDSVIKKSTYYLYLYDGTNQTQTYKRIKEKFPKIFKDKNLIIFISADGDQKNKDRKKKNVQEKFKPLNIFYIDEFIREHCTPKVIFEEESKFLNISNFISPVIDKDQNEIEVYEFFKNWYKTLDEPIFVIKGSGGIGKTTLAQSLADGLISDFPNHYVLFIDSVQIKDNLLKNKNADNLSLYSFYEALYDITENIEEKLSEELFRLNLDAGNILIVIDGLDEVISKIPNFNVHDFIQSIKNSTSELGSGKVIISCRSYFWDQTIYSENLFTVIELEPFNESQAKEFFVKSFGTESRRVQKAIKLANDFKYPGNKKSNIFHPYVLDIIRSIIEIEKNTDIVSVSELSSKFLNSKIKNDYIIYRVCERERIRIGQISVDEQIEFFIHFSIHRRGIIRLEDFKNEINSSLKKRIDIINVEAFKSHPFLKKIDNSVTFRYDFLADLFKSLYMSSFFNFTSGEVKISKPFIEIIIESCWYGSPLNQEIVNRIEHWNEDDILLVSDLIDQIRTSGLLKQDLLNRAIANFFNLCLTIQHKFVGNDVVSNTGLLKDLFQSKKNTLNDLQIININSDQNIRFDFSDLEILDAKIDSFSNFWKSNFNKNTRFVRCTLLNLNLKTDNPDLTKENFIDCTFDSSVEDSLDLVETKSQNQFESLKNFLNQFFHLFISNGRLGRQWEHKVIAPRFNGINKQNVSYKKLIKILKKNEIIESSEELSKTKLAVCEKSKETVVKFIKDGTTSPSIIRIIEELSS